MSTSRNHRNKKVQDSCIDLTDRDSSSLQKSLEFTLPIRPISLNCLYRSGVSGKGKSYVYLSAKGKEFTQRAKTFLPVDSIHGLIKVKIHYHLKGRRLIDLDNCSKGLLDVMKGNVMDDDSNVRKIVKTVDYGNKEDLIHVTIQPL